MKEAFVSANVCFLLRTNRQRAECTLNLRVGNNQKVKNTEGTEFAKLSFRDELKKKRIFVCFFCNLIENKPQKQTEGPAGAQQPTA